MNENFLDTYKKSKIYYQHLKIFPKDIRENVLKMRYMASIVRSRNKAQQNSNKLEKLMQEDQGQYQIVKNQQREKSKIYYMKKKEKLEQDKKFKEYDKAKRDKKRLENKRNEYIALDKQVPFKIIEEINSINEFLKIYFSKDLMAIQSD